MVTWDIGVAVRSCNINKPNNFVSPLSYSENYLNDVWNSFYKLFSPHITSFNSLS